ASDMRKRGRPSAARRLYIRLGGRELPRPTLERIQKSLALVEQEILAVVPDEDRKTIAMATDHPVWKRLDAVASQFFIYIGDRDYVRRIPPASMQRLDLAYVFLTDLDGRVPNPDGDRLTIFFKELWNFGGGVGGGTVIDVGSSDPPALMDPAAKWERKGNPVVDDGLFYHELSHCVFDLHPVYGGFIEGIANFGAAFVLDVLHQKGDSLHSFQENLDRFK